jgi:hypothetical protein
VHEKGRTLEFDKRTGSLSARLAGSQNMAAQQKAAVTNMKLHRKLQRHDLSPSPREVFYASLKTAKAEKDKHNLLRTGLNERRARDQQRVGSRSDRAQEDAQGRVRQAVLSGIPLTGAERTNASPEIKEQLARHERKAEVRTFFEQAVLIQQKRDRGGQDRARGGRDR